MKVSRIFILFALIFSIALSVGLGLYISRDITNKDNISIQGITVKRGEVETSAKVNSNTNYGSKSPMLNSIGPTTKITQKNIYTKGEPYEESSKVEITEDIIGMDKTAFEQHIKSKGFSLDEFTGDNVVIYKKVDKWPNGLYVLKSVGENIVLYSVDSLGNLKEIRTTDVILEQVSEHEKQGLIKGVVYKSMEVAESTLEDYDS